MGFSSAMAHAVCAMALGLSPAFALKPGDGDEGMCVVDDPNPAGPWQQSGTAANSDCLIRASALKSVDAGTILVDVRPRSQIAKVWVPGAASIPPVLVGMDMQVKASAFTLLLGSGKDTSRLLRLCTELRAGGLKQIHVLDGGVPGWHRGGGRVAGDIESLEAPLQLGDSDLHEILRHQEATLVMAGVQPGDAVQGSGLHIEGPQGTSASPKVVLKRIRTRQPGNGVTVVFLPSINDAASWRAAAVAAGMADPLFYVGDGDRYDKFVRRLASIAEGATRRRDAGCGSS